MTGVTFKELHRAMPRSSGADRMAVFFAQDEAEQAVAWQHLAGDIADRRFLDGDLPFQSRKSKPVKPKITRPAAYVGAGRRVADDWEHGTEALVSIPSEIYIPALTASEPLPGGLVRCPLPDHEDLHPSASYRDTVFYCHRCSEGGGIFQLGAALTGLQDRGDQFIELRQWLIEQMLGVNP